MSNVQNLHQLLEVAVESGASDLHLSPGIPPFLRIYGNLRPITGYDRLMPNDIEILVKEIITPEHWKVLDDKGEVDFSYGVRGLARFRCSVYRQRSSLSVAMRVIKSNILPFEELGLPPVIYDVARKKDGLVLVTGPTGSGKTTTLASMINIINQERQGLIITLEDPIEYLHTHKNCIINQREIGSDTKSFASGLRSALRADPDVILVGEMRDLETIATAISAAETGHLVLSTLHTRGAAKTIDRIVDAFAPENQQQIRLQLSTVLEAVISQQLIPRKDGQGMVPAVEILLGTPAVSNMIREGKTHQLNSLIETGIRFGMKTLQSSLDELVEQDLIDIDEANVRIKQWES